MTQAICFSCGATKFGAFTPCSACATQPETEDQIAVSLLLTDHFMDAATLAENAERIRTSGKQAAVPPEMRDELLQSIRQGSELFAQTPLGDVMTNLMNPTAAPRQTPQEIQVGHHRFPTICARCGTDEIAGLWPITIQGKPSIHASSIFTILLGSVVMQQRQQTIPIPICADCRGPLEQIKRGESRFQVLVFLGIALGLFASIYGLFQLPFAYLNIATTIFLMVGGIICGLALTLLLFRLFVGPLRLLRGNGICHWDGEELHFANERFMQRYQEILAR
ncbi:MAG TPA: hypothetical protein P5121_38635 [Caldilineaceae bacterium]|nr:hypothetical protein [Caldilineaceae bacterium]